MFFMINIYPWKFAINVNVLKKGTGESLIKDFSKSGHNIQLFLKKFHNFLLIEKKFKKTPPTFSEIIAFQLINEIYFYIIYNLADKVEPDYLLKVLEEKGFSERILVSNINLFLNIFSPVDLEKGEFLKRKISIKDKDTKFKKTILSHMLIIRIMNENPACEHFNIFFEDTLLLKKRVYKRIIETYKKRLEYKPVIPDFEEPLLKILYEPIVKNPHSILKQLDYIKSRWSKILPLQIMKGFDILEAVLEEENINKGAGGPGPIEVIEFKKPDDLKHHDSHEYPEFEAYTPDTDWMPNVVLIAKMAYVWLYQLSKQYHREIKRLDEIPDEELDKLAKWGFNALWLIGIWERSPASQRIKHLCGNIDAASSAYSLYDYTVAEELGGWQALDSLKERAWKRGIRLACDIVPNHMGITSKWIFEHPDWFLQSDFSPFPNYRFTGENLSSHPDYVVQIEDGYYTRTDAAVVFRFEEKKTGKIRYIYHGNDGTSTPWNDTAQLNYLIPQVRQMMIQTIVNIARHFPIIRFDAAMTLAKKHYQRLWFPLPGHGGGVPSRNLFSMKKSEFDKLMPKEFWREVVETINSQVPDTLLIAEAFWLMEGYFVRTLGMHRVYNSAFMNMLKMEENAKYRQTIKNILEFDRRILQRFVNFMNNPDEKTAVEQFGKGDKYFGVAVMLVTMPGLPMFGHGQIEGFHEKYGMEYKRAYYDEQPDQYFISQHEEKIFPLMKKRRLFSGSENFYFYDFVVDGNIVNENVFVYSNMFGNDRALIIYNNHLSTTKGTIKNSVKYLKKLDDGKEIFESKSLVDALGLRREPFYFYVCKDYNSHLEYLLNGKDIDQNGIFLELNGYQYYAFLNFKEIYDENGYYQELYQKLDNRPVKSIEDELKLLKYKKIHDAFRSLIIEFITHTIIGGGQYDILSDKISAFYIFLNENGFYDLFTPEKTKKSINTFHGLVGKFQDLSNKYNDFANYKKEVYLIFLLYSIFNNLTEIEKEKYAYFQKLTKEIKLDVILNELFVKFIEDGIFEHSYVNLFNIFGILLKYLDDFKDFTFVKKILSSEEDGNILGCNTHEGTRWFNKELFEIFIASIVPIAIENIESERAEIFSLTIKIVEIARESQYKVLLFLKNLNNIKFKLSTSDLTRENL